MADTLPSARSIVVAVASEAAGQRLDRYLAASDSGLSRSRLKSLIESGMVTIDGYIQKDPNHRLTVGNEITVLVPAPIEDYPVPQDIELSVIFEDRDLIVVNKPAGLVVHPAPGNRDKTLVNALLAHCGSDLRGIGGVKRPGIVHRLDKETSGILVAAKTEEAHHGLVAQFSRHDILRLYRALVWGMPNPRKGTLEGAIGRSPRNRKKMAIVSHGGKAAVTHYTIEESFGIQASLLACTLETGRTHQIRVHLTAKGNSIVGDPVYGSIRRGVAEPLRDAARAFGRQALHAAELGFQHPVTGQEMSFTADLPEDFRHLLDVFRQGAKLKQN